MTEPQGTWWQRPFARTTVALALLAYLPALIAAPGRMPADSKLYLYLHPGRFVGDAASSFDGRQFAGWVPHQHVAYLWPSTPWFWLFETLGVPDWVAHRLWIGSILLVAGLGVRWCARLLGLGPLAAFTAAVVYQLALYVLPYVSRTSVMLLPWAGLGWIVALTVRATRRQTWGDPAAIALVVFTVGAVNATALAMIVPAPVLWLVHTRWRGAITNRQALTVVLRTGLLATAASLWWIVMLVIQGRYGTDVLPYSESLADVSLTATSAETWRSLGYWLFYVRDPYAATTTESLRYLSSTPAIVVSYLVPLSALAALTWSRWEHRRFVLLLVTAGMVLAVGVHPVDDRSPLMALLTGGGDGGLALALRSSTRALPVMMLGVALAIAMAVEAARGYRLPRLGWSTSRTLAAASVFVAIVNLPSLWTGAFVDPALERDHEPPEAWLAAAEALDAGRTGARVLQLPGAEFGAYRWGYTVDQPLPGLTDKPLVTRDLLPLGSAGAMDLLYALDDRAQDGVLEPESVAPVARLLGADTVWLTNDIAFDRFRTARPEVVRDVVIGAPGLGDPIEFGELFLNRPEVPVTDERAVGDSRVGEPIVPVELVPVADAPGIVRAADRTLVVSGSGDGVVDGAAAGLVDGSVAVRYSASPAETELASPIGLLVTDSNRDRARHWRSSQDTTGYTEPGGPDQDVLRPVASDAQLELFGEGDSVSQTVAEQRGPVTATATSYGEPFAYLPEHRPFAAIDGDPDTAWIVGEHGDPVGERIRLGWPGGSDELRIVQPWSEGDRRIGAITLTTSVDGESTSRTVELDDRSVAAPGQPVPLPVDAAGTIDITIDRVIGGTPFTASAVSGVGFSELDLGLGASTEVTRPPHDALDDVAADEPLALAFTRLRTDPMDRWRSDPEPTLIREFELTDPRSFRVEATVRVDARSSDAELAAAFGWPAAASTRLTGSPRHAGMSAIDGDPGTAWITAFGEADGARLSIEGATEPISSIAVRQPVAGFSAVTALTIRSGGEERTVELVPDAAGGSSGRIDPPLPAGDVEIVLSGVDVETTVDRRFGDVVQLPAAISEIEFTGAPSAAPVAQTEAVFDCVPVIDVDGDVLLATVEVSGDAWLDGSALPTTMCDATASLGADTHLLAPTPSMPAVLQLDRVVLDDGLRDVLDAVPEAAASATVTERSRFERTIEVRDCAAGCWLIVGEGFNEAWAAEAAGRSLGEPQLVDGGFNGWWLDAGFVGPSEAVTVTVTWTAQTPLTVALLVSLVVAIAAVGIVIVDRRRGDVSTFSGPSRDAPWVAMSPPALSGRSAIGLAAAWAVAAALLVGPLWALWGVVGGVVVAISRRARLVELTALSTLLVVAAVVVVRERRGAPAPDGGWPSTFESVHGLGMFAVAALVAAAVFVDDAPPIVNSDGLDESDRASGDEPIADGDA